ncbi:MAG: hypothetical protein M1819_000034 [Sarea resinae]|nr:MAG: hypothetical protein M1819_000034 [Sarea resinae]
MAQTASALPSDEPGAPSPEYYRQIPDLSRRFENFDARSTYKKFEAFAGDIASQNFVIDFSNDEAWAASDLSPRDIDGLLKSARPDSLRTRWINIWAPNRDPKVVEAIADYYDFSPRLFGLMRSAPLKPIPVHVEEHKSRFHFDYWSQHTVPRSPTSCASDVEGAIELVEKESEDSADEPFDLNHYHLVDEVWHYSSVDWGKKYLCLGYNSLFNIRTENFENIREDRGNRDLPDGKRVWTWLILCDGGTVITLHEDPFPGQHSTLSSEQQKVLLAIRRNLLVVLGQLSQANDARASQNPITLLPIRKRKRTWNNAQAEAQSPTNPSDAPSLLFYYLFDDWFTSYGLVVKQGHQYGSELNKLRKKMLQRAELEHIDRLHHIGRQLGVLKRLYQSYELIIERVLEKQKPATLRQLQANDSFVGLSHMGVSVDDEAPFQISMTPQTVLGDADMLGTTLSPAAIVRFERLKDRIRLYALSEIQECLDEKESLVLVNFNLIAIKESFSVERLTRFTLLLSKVTILFMPISLMTGYFSVSIDDLQGVYTAKTYWICFAVIMFLSSVLLAGFSLVSGTMEGKTLYRPFSRKVIDIGKRVVGASSREKKRRQKLG